MKYPARIVFPGTGLVNSPKTIYHVALKLISCRVTTDILSHTCDKGGYRLAPLEAFLYWQHSTAFVNHVNSPLHVPKILSHSFQLFAKELGLCVNSTTPHTFQMGSDVIWNKMLFLGWSTRAFSLVKQCLCFAEPDLLAYHTVIWHSTFFRNQHNQSYLAPRLIKMGVLRATTLTKRFHSSSTLGPPPSWTAPVGMEIIFRGSSCTTCILRTQRLGCSPK